MIKMIKRALGIVLLTLGLVILFLVIIGGGYSAKPAQSSLFTKSAKPLLFSHRGLILDQPENSLGAITEAVNGGFIAIEIDIQQTKDGEFVLFHDQDCGRMLGNPDTVYELTLAELSESLLLRNDEQSDQRIATLDSVFERHGSTLFYYLDMKRYGKGGSFELADDIFNVVNGFGLNDRTLVASSDVWFIAYLEFNHPEIITVLEGVRPSWPGLFQLIPNSFRADLIATSYNSFSDDFVSWLKETNMMERYIVYHAEKDEIRRALSEGVEMLIVDYDQLVDSLLNSRQSE